MIFPGPSWQETEDIKQNTALAVTATKEAAHFPSHQSQKELESSAHLLSSYLQFTNIHSNILHIPRNGAI